jgi:hypothetical protein
LPQLTALPHAEDEDGEDVESKELGSATKGKEAELLVLLKLLERGFKVYTPMVDTGVDCLVDVGGGTYKEIQVKSREGTEPTFRSKAFKPLPTSYFVCVLRGKRNEDYWVIPSKVFAEKGTVSKVGKKEYILLRIGKEGSPSYSEFAKYHDWGTLLSGATKEIKKTIQRAFKRVEGEHLTKTDYETESLRILAVATTPLGRKEILAELKDRLGHKFKLADVEILKTRSRWETYARFAISTLAINGMIEPRERNQWVITEKGRNFDVYLSRIPVEAKIKTAAQKIG